MRELDLREEWRAMRRGDPKDFVACRRGPATEGDVYSPVSNYRLFSDNIHCGRRTVALRPESQRDAHPHAIRGPRRPPIIKGRTDPPPKYSHK